MTVTDITSEMRFQCFFNSGSGQKPRDEWLLSEALVTTIQIVGWSIYPPKEELPELSQKDWRHREGTKHNS